MKKLNLVLLIALTGTMLSGCAFLRELNAFTKCDFKFKNVTNVTLANISLQNKKSLKEFSLVDGAKLLTAVATNTVPLQLNVNLLVTNPNSVNAALSGGEWIFFIDSKEMLRGNINQRVEIAANNGTAVLPLTMQLDLKKLLTKETKETLVNFALGLATQEGESTRVSLWIKPVIDIAGVKMNYPDYIRLGKAF